MALSKDVEQFLIINFKNNFFPNSIGDEGKELVCFDEVISRFANDLNSSVPESGFFPFYLAIAFPPLGRGNELLTIEEIEESFSSDRDFIRISSFESDYYWAWNKKSDQIVDVISDYDENLVFGEQFFTSFNAFLNWYYRIGEQEARG